MDIMNNMTVSTSKLTFTLIAISALLISGSGLVLQDAYALGKVSDAPEFTAIHINTTATKLTFDNPVNGTLRILDWTIMLNSTAVLTSAGGSQLTDVRNADGTLIEITNITNGTTSGVRLDGGHVVDSFSSIATAADKAAARGNAGTLGDDTAFGFINNSKVIILVHSAIDSDKSYFINYTGNTASSNEIGGLTGYIEGFTANKIVSKTLVKIGANATAQDHMVPTAVSAEILKSNPKQVRILMSEAIANVNSTVTEFDISVSGGGINQNAVIPGQIYAGNDTTQANKYLYVNLQNPATVDDILSLTYTAYIDTSTSYIGSWITDAINSGRHGAVNDIGGGSELATPGTNGGGVGNRVSNFTVSITNWLEVGMYGDVTSCYDCHAPIVTDVKVSLDSSTPITVNDDNKVHINAAIGDTVSVMVTVADNLGADTIPFAGLYTNFGDTPDNLYYANNFDSAKQMSTSYYEWNVRNDDIAFDNQGAITWADATSKVNPDRTQTFTYTMTINDSLDSSQVWVDIGDKAGNYGKSALPITLEVSGAPGLTFASDDSQKVVSFFNESILLAIVSQWTATSSDDASNVEQLSSVLGIESQLPTWTTDLASWVADDKIDVADMIVAVEYVINQ